MEHWKETWAHEYVRNGGNALKAYSVAKPNSSYATCQTEGSKMARNPEVMGLVGKIKSEMTISRFLTSDERRQFLADTVRANPQTVMSENPHLAQAVTVTRRITESGEVEEKVQVKLPDKLKALALDAAMAGELAPNQQGTGELAPVGNALDSLMGLVLAPPATPTLSLPAPALDGDDEDLL